MSEDKIATRRGHMASEGLSLKSVDARRSRHAINASESLPPPSITQLVHHNVANPRLRLGNFPDGRSPSASPTRISQHLLQDLSVEKSALKALKGNIDKVKDILERKSSQRWSMPPDATMLLTSVDVREILTLITQSQDERGRLARLAESREEILLHGGLQRQSPGGGLSPRPTEGTERSSERGGSPYPGAGPQDARQFMRAESRALDVAKQALKVLEENLADAEKRQRVWTKLGKGEDPDISDEIQEHHIAITAQREEIDGLEQSVERFQEIVDGQEEDPLSETSSQLGISVDSEGISKWREGYLAAKD